MARSANGKSPAIARVWRGRVKAGKADEYARYLYEAGIRPLEEKALGVQLFREDRGSECEFVTISYWESVEAMARFAGPDPRRIHHLPRDEEFLVELPAGVQVLQIVAAHGATGGDTRQAGAQDGAENEVTYEVVEHDGGWAYRVGDVYSETFPSHEEALEAAERAAEEQRQPGETNDIEYEDEQGRWHREVARGTDRPATRVKDAP